MARRDDPAETGSPSATQRGAASWIVLGLVGGTCVTLAVLLTSGLSFADEAGQPFGAPAVAITPTSSTHPTSSASPTSVPAGEFTSGPPEVVGAPPPVTVHLNAGGGDKGDKGNSGTNGNSGSSGTGSGSGSNGTGSGGSGSGSGSSGSGSGSGSGGSGSNGGSGSGGSGPGGSGTSGGSNGGSGNGSGKG